MASTVLERLRKRIRLMTTVTVQAKGATKYSNEMLSRNYSRVTKTAVRLKKVGLTSNESHSKPNRKWTKVDEDSGKFFDSMERFGQ